MKTRKDRSRRNRRPVFKPTGSRNLTLESLEARRLLTVVVADASTQQVDVYDHSSGVRISSLATPSGSYECSNTLSFLACDGLAIGDVNGDGADEIIQGTNQTGRIESSQPGGGYPMTAFSGGAYGGFDFGNRRAIFDIDLGPLDQGHISATTILAEREVILYQVELPYAVVAAEGGYFVLDTAGSLLTDTGTGSNDTELALFDDQGKLLATNDDASETRRESRLVFGDQVGSLGDLPAGTYHIAYGAFDTTFGPDRFNMTSAATAIGSSEVLIQYSTPVDLGVLTAGVVSVSTPMKQGELLEYRFEVPLGVGSTVEESLVIDSIGSEIQHSFRGASDTEIAVYDSNGKLIATNDNIREGIFESVLEFGGSANSVGSLLPGVYYLTVAAHDAEFGPTRLDRTSRGFDVGAIQVNFDYRNSIVQLGLPGDLDGDNEVGFSDFLILSQAFGTTVDPPGTGADLDGDGDVGFSDFLILADNFGRKLESRIG